MKIRVKKFLAVPIFAAIFAVSGWTAEAPVFGFDTGDKVVFIGDSITHGGSYHADIFLFYATRFPSKAFIYYNCGISGDTASGAVARFDRDIAVHHPNVATIMLGMNDVGRGNYGAQKTSPGDISARDHSFDVYRESMDRLASRLTSAGSRMVFITPSIYDQTAQLASGNNFGVDDGLSRFAESVYALAEKYHSPVVDFHAIMSRVNREIQKNNPAATVVGPDRIHPGAPGHLVMAYAFLCAQQMPEYVSSIGIDAAAAKTTETVNCEVEQIRSVAPNGISFACREFALPFPVSEAQKPALNWVPFQQKLNREILTVKNLAAGSYNLKIDNLLVAAFSAADLDRGVNLADYPNTPQYRQALDVKEINDRRLEISKKLRTIALVRYRFLSNLETVPEDDEALSRILYAAIEKIKTTSGYSYLKKQCDDFIELRRSENDFRQQTEALFARIDQVNKPKFHQWEITPADRN